MYFVREAEDEVLLFLVKLLAALCSFSEAERLFLRVTCSKPVDRIHISSACRFELTCFDSLSARECN